MSTKDAEIARLFNEAADAVGGDATESEFLAGLRAVAAAAWDEGEDAGRRSIPRPNPYANALISVPTTEE